MSALAPMTHLWRCFYYASPKQFVEPGLYVWNGVVHRRVIPFPSRTEQFTPRTFPEVTTTYTKGQPQYNPLPSFRDSDGRAVFLWRLNWRARLRVLLKGEVWHEVMTFNAPLQPQRLSTDKPTMT